MRLLLAALFGPILAFNAVAGELAVVFPNGFEDVEGNDGDGVGGIVSEVGLRFQQVYPSSQFANVPASHSYITAIRYRPDGNLPLPFSITSPGDVLRLSTTDKEPGQLSSVFSQNVGDDEIVVFQGDNVFATANTGPPGGPKDFDYGFQFQTPFHYDPSEGKNLLFDITIVGETLEAGFDFHDSVRNPTEWISADDPNARGATGRGSRTAIVQFEFVPEPSTLILSVLGMVAMIGRSRRI